MHEDNDYFSGPVTADRVLEAAAKILAARSSTPTKKPLARLFNISFYGCLVYLPVILQRCVE